MGQGKCNGENKNVQKISILRRERERQFRSSCLRWNVKKTVM